MRRLTRLLEHLTVADDDTSEVVSLKQRLSVASLRAQFTLSEERLREMSLYMIHEMHKGLTKPVGESGSTLKMLPAYVYRRSTLHTDGVFYALDLGGTNFRVIRMLLRKGELMNYVSSQFAIPKKHMTGTSDGLFGFIAESVLKFVKEKGVDDHVKNETRKIPLGFTFSFPINQLEIDSGTLIRWTKGFTTTGVQGQDVVILLQKALDQIAVNLKVVALCNDTVGTLVARYFSDPHVELGVILGTGANACYWERTYNVKKDPKVLAVKDQDVVINMEFGNFDSEHHHVLPITKYDAEIDRTSPNPGAQLLEKMISGMYIGEISRQILVCLSNNGSLAKDVAEKLSVPYSFTSKSSGLISSDRLPGLHFTKNVLKKLHGIEMGSEQDRHVVREVCVLVRNRAAQLAGMAVSATLLKSERHGNATVAIDGSVYEKTPSFKAVMQRTIMSILGPDADVRVVLQKEGSGHGAGFIAALATS